MDAPQESPHFPHAFHRVTVKGLCVREGKILMCKDFTNTHTKRWEWELPGGGLDFGEGFRDALRREVQEEMGLTVTSVAEEPTYVWTSKHGPGRGMDWYYILLLVFKFEVKDLQFTPSEECREIRLFTSEELKANLADVAEQIRPLANYFDPKDFL